MVKKILIFGLSLLSVGSVEKLVGMQMALADAHNKKEAGYYNRLRNASDCEDAIEMCPVSSQELETGEFNRKRKKKNNKVVLDAHNVASVGVHDDQIFDQAMYSVVDRVRDIASACKPLLIPAIVMCCVGAAAAMSGDSCTALGCSATAMKAFNVCVKSVEHFAGKSGSISSQYHTCSLAFDGIEALAASAKNCGDAAYDSLFEVEYLRKDCKSIAEQIKADAKFLRAYETYDQQFEAAQGKRLLDDLVKRDKERGLLGVRDSNFVAEWMKWNWWPVYDRKMVAQLVTLPAARRKFFVEVQKLNNLLSACSSK